MRELADALEDVDADRSLRVSVLMSAGKAFCAGADLASPTGVGGQGMAGINPLYEQAVRLFSAKKPIIAAVQGAAVRRGAGASRWSPISAWPPPRPGSPPTSSNSASIRASASPHPAACDRHATRPS